MDIQTKPEVNAELFVQQTVADAAQFRETQSIFKDWLWSQKIAITQYHGCAVFLMDRRKNGHIVARAEFPTFAQALSFALAEAEKRIKEPIDGA